MVKIIISTHYVITMPFWQFALWILTVSYFIALIATVSMSIMWYMKEDYLMRYGHGTFFLDWPFRVFVQTVGRNNVWVSKSYKRDIGEGVWRGY